MTSFSARTAFGAAAVTVLGFLAVTPAGATSPSFSVVCASAQVEAPRNQTTTFALSCEDVDGNAVDSYAVVAQPTKAQTFSVNAATGAVSYRPVTGAAGTDTFTFKGVVDGLGESAVTTAVVTLGNNRPACGTVAPVSVTHDDSVVVPLSCTDADGDTVTVATGTTGATHGTVAVASGVVTYTPAAGYVGSDAFTLRGSDGDKLSEEVAVAVSVTNARPTCSGLAVKTVHDRATTFSLTCADADGDALTRSVLAAAQHGSVTLKGNAVTYRPAAGYVGTDVFSVVATDGLQASVAAPVTVRVTNAIPVCSGAAKLKSKGKAVPVKIACTDGDRDKVSVVVVTAPEHGKLVRKGASWSYVPAKGYKGKDTFSLRGTDGVAVSKPVGYTVTVKPAKR